MECCQCEYSAFRYVVGEGNVFARLRLTFILGQTDPHSFGARPLGQHNGSLYRLCPAHRRIRPHWQTTLGRRKRGDLSRQEAIRYRHIHSARIPYHRFGRPHSLPVASSSERYCPQETLGSIDRSPEAGESRCLFARWQVCRFCGFRQLGQVVGWEDWEVCG